MLVQVTSNGPSRQLLLELRFELSGLARDTSLIAIYPCYLSDYVLQEELARREKSSNIIQVRFWYT